MSILKHYFTIDIITVYKIAILFARNGVGLKAVSMIALEMAISSNIQGAKKFI